MKEVIVMKECKLENGQVFKNYKELCAFMGWKITAGDAKKRQLKQLNSLCEYHKDGNRIIVDEVFETPREIEDGRGKNRKIDLSTNSSFNVKKEHEKLQGIYKITLNDEIYLGYTLIKTFRETFMRLLRDEKRENLRTMLNDGGVFEIVQISNNMSKSEIIEELNKIIDDYSKDPKWKIVNKRSGINIERVKAIGKVKRIPIDCDNFYVDELQENSKGIYKITLDNKIYIGSTVKSFKIRYIQHCSRFNKLPTREMLQQGGIFEVLEVCDGMEEPEIREMENKWIARYINDEEWEIMNKNFAWSYEKNITEKIDKELKELIEELGIEKSKEILRNYIDK